MQRYLMRRAQSQVASKETFAEVVEMRAVAVVLSESDPKEDLWTWKSKPTRALEQGFSQEVAAFWSGNWVMNTGGPPAILPSSWQSKSGSDQSCDVSIGWKPLKGTPFGAQGGSFVRQQVCTVIHTMANLHYWVTSMILRQMVAHLLTCPVWQGFLTT